MKARADEHSTLADLTRAMAWWLNRNDAGATEDDAALDIAEPGGRRLDMGDIHLTCAPLFRGRDELAYARQF
jgi:hypothetical protein